MTVASEHVGSARGECEVGGASRPFAGCTSSGDTWQAFHGGSSLTLLVVDGVGHGDDAAYAATRATEAVAAELGHHSDPGLDVLMQRCHAALQGTRGAAVGLLRFDLARSRTEYCGVGNVSVQAVPKRKGLGVSLPGTVGYRMRRPVVFAGLLQGGDTFALATDGIASGFELEAVAGLPVEQAARETLERYGKAHDDATVVLARYRSAARDGERRPR